MESKWSPTKSSLPAIATGVSSMQQVISEPAEESIHQMEPHGAESFTEPCLSFLTFMTYKGMRYNEMVSVLCHKVLGVRDNLFPIRSWRQTIRHYVLPVERTHHHKDKGTNLHLIKPRDPPGNLQEIHKKVNCILTR